MSKLKNTIKIHTKSKYDFDIKKYTPIVYIYKWVLNVLKV